MSLDAVIRRGGRPPAVGRSFAAIVTLAPDQRSAEAATVQLAIVLGAIGLAIGAVHGVGMLGPLPIAVDATLSIAIQAAIVLGVIIAIVRASGERWSSLGLESHPIGHVLSSSLATLLLLYLATATVGGAYVLISNETLTTVAESKAGGFTLLLSLPWPVAVLISLLAGFGEETLFRGMLLSRLVIALWYVTGSRRAAIVCAVALSAAIFASGHLYWGLFGAMQTAGVSVMLAAVAIARRSIWSCIVAHGLFNLLGFAATRLLLP